MHPDIDKYAHLESVIHRWEPRVKIVSILVLIFTIATLQHPQTIGLCFLLALGMVLASRLPLGFVTRRLLPVSIFLLPFFVIMPLTVPGKGAVHILMFSFNPDALQLAGQIYVKAISIVMLLVVMIGTAPFVDSMKALERLKVPGVIVQMILFTYRYVFVFLLEMRRMNTALKARNFEKKTDMHTLRTLGNFVGVLLVRSFERAERIYQAMISRGYDGTLRTFFEYSIVPRDYIKAGILVSLSGLVFWWDKFVCR